MKSKAYIYDEGLYCKDCADGIVAELDGTAAPRLATIGDVCRIDYRDCTGEDPTCEACEQAVTGPSYERGRPLRKRITTLGTLKLPPGSTIITCLLLFLSACGSSAHPSLVCAVNDGSKLPAFYEGPCEGLETGEVCAGQADGQNYVGVCEIGNPDL
jgi:hypothetical protein